MPLQQRRTPQQPFEPAVGQAGKDVVWVPTPPELVEKMLDMAQVTPQDFVMDLGPATAATSSPPPSAAPRAIGVEFNPDMVALSNRLAKEAGVADKATFVEGDMFDADISKATVIALFLLPDNLDKLRDKFLRPAARHADRAQHVRRFPTGSRTSPRRSRATARAGARRCSTSCRRKVAGTWKTAAGRADAHAAVSDTSRGTLTAGGKTVPIASGKLRGDQITFTAGGAEFTGKVMGDRIEGTAATDGKRQPWTAARAK